ncbi:hypothetical protein K435DRAFT_800246 [Dendrothele bispora CBS 962.96]|uniref:Uncharacterized protein n=1 Tax=Dendrothele bispora (strain CBS 962.96) TaxID=1314807 RepID=A0A4S8LTC5_DENBC|nr:hypothetical protein K435DRAFT_800246 [Dendrothele bispora CBS 962.96]
MQVAQLVLNKFEVMGVVGLRHNSPPMSDPVYQYRLPSLDTVYQYRCQAQIQYINTGYPVEVMGVVGLRYNRTFIYWLLLKSTNVRSSISIPVSSPKYGISIPVAKTRYGISIPVAKPDTVYQYPLPSPDTEPKSILNVIWHLLTFDSLTIDQSLVPSYVESPATAELSLSSNVPMSGPTFHFRLIQLQLASQWSLPKSTNQSTMTLDPVYLYQSPSPDLVYQYQLPSQIQYINTGCPAGTERVAVKVVIGIVRLMFKSEVLHF